jgi:hypothetical protein
LTMAGMENVLDNCHRLVSLSLAGSRLTHTCVLSAITEKSGKRLEVLNLCGSLQLDASLLSEIGSRCNKLRLLNIAACMLTQSSIDNWLSNPDNVPKQLHGLNISCNSDLYSNLPITISKIAGAFPCLKYLTCVTSIRPLKRCKNSVKAFIENVHSSVLSGESSLKVICCASDIGTHELGPYHNSPRAPLNPALQVDDLISTLLMSKFKLFFAKVSLL